MQRALLARARGKLPEAAGILVDALTRWGAGGHRALLAWTQGVLGGVLLDWGEPERGREMLADAVELWQALRCPWAVAWLRFEQGRWMVDRQPHQARKLLGESLRIRAEIGDRRGVAECLEAMLEAERAALPAADWLQIFGLAQHLRSRLQCPAPEAAAERLASRCETIAAHLGPTEAPKSLAAGAGLAIMPTVQRLLALRTAAADR